MTYTWPTRDEWQAAAEPFIRTYCTPRERVPSRAKRWLSPAELDELRATANRVAAALRRTLTRTVTTLGPKFPDEPDRVIERLDWEDALSEDRRGDYEHLHGAREDRRQIGRDARVFDDPNLTVLDAESAGRRFARIGAEWGTSETTADLERVAFLLAAMTERCDTAASAATEDEVQDEIARRATDEAWTKELARRDRIDQVRTSPIFH